MQMLSEGYELQRLWTPKGVDGACPRVRQEWEPDCGCLFSVGRGSVAFI